MFLGVGVVVVGMDTDGLFRHECTNCGRVVFSDELHLSECTACDDEYAAMRHMPTPEHDAEVGLEPSFACPECGVKMFATATETGEDWVCARPGGCGFYGWCGVDSSIRPPNALGEEEAARQDAWSRRQRYDAGEYEYREKQ